MCAYCEKNKQLTKKTSIFLQVYRAIFFRTLVILGVTPLRKNSRTVASIVFRTSLQPIITIASYWFVYAPFTFFFIIDMDQLGFDFHNSYMDFNRYVFTKILFASTANKRTMKQTAIKLNTKRLVVLPNTLPIIPKTIGHMNWPR